MNIQRLITKATGTLGQSSSGLKKSNLLPTGKEINSTLNGIQAKASQGIAMVKIALSPKQKALKEIPEELLKIFESTKGKEGEEFANAAYDSIVKYLKLEGIAPDKINIGDIENKSILGGVTFGYNPFENKISSSSGFFTSIKRPKQFNGIAHELKHCKQYNQIVQTEGLGIEKLADAFCEQNFNIWLDQEPNILIGKTNLQIIQDKYGDKAAEILKQKKQEFYESILTSFTKNFSKTASLPKYSLESKQGQKALEYLKAVREYKGIGTFGAVSEDYLNNALEKEAYEFGNKIQKFYEKYIQNI